MIGKLCFLLAFLQAVVSEEWRADTPPDVTAQRGLCARIPCRYTYPSRLANKPRTGIWINDENWKSQSIAFSSKVHQVSLHFRHRTRLSGDLKDGDCSLVIDNVMQKDEGPYFFRVEFKGKDSHSYLPVTRLHVSDFTDKPSIFPAEVVVGKPVNIRCTFETTCDESVPRLTWDIPTDVLSSNSSSITQRGDTLIYTSVLTLTPELKHHGHNLTCRVRYPSVSSEQTLTLTLQNGSSSIWKVVLITAGIIFCIALAGFFIYRYIQRRKAKRASGNKDPAISYSPTSVMHQDAGSRTPLSPPQVPTGASAGQEEGYRHEGPLYAQLQELPCRGASVPKVEATEYASIRFQ
ncbi:myeloid cell surface antigen CD33-like isoform X1 [Pristis pectinata]|uniref:myeloid cell surface antigen CD33-like isoform X1 n=1 Tax=Pristis pectinata TaxID=685728 RepID=UPI00223E5465|nr:myeloid cell surface antigen CD33-like isoform X1 [Pristis pectinata]XP_051901479.1 myeloid cell surface antigen CD33-like isoform X1 [Pristis pectinata]XP_051901480.1 myeloid cell surface antigen CD33-like isoform X1 [Pristis pectinata]XP_051901481.1 myeloid cell surface antigen CD33-like isoform X1 [Pristis pectinata]XP_051901482.1 myeloid cell surface antigen CD33-like isoform X1 [Pristis pectinata]